MKKIYSIVLMAAALFVGTNAWATSVSTWDGLKAALQAGGEVTLSDDISVNATNAATWNGIWIGSVSVDGNAPKAVLDLNGHNIIINSGNYQRKGVTKEQALNPFVITKGSLTIKSDSPAKIQVVKGQSVISKSTNVFSVFGADDANKVDPKGNNPFTYLEIGKNVTVETQNGTVVAIDALKVGHAAVGSNTNYTTYPSGATSGYAYGARIEIKGSLISQGAESTTTSTDKKTGLTSYQNKCYGIKVNGLVASPAAENKMYAPYVHIHPSAVLQSDNRSGFVKVNEVDVAIMAGSAAVYASGFAQWLIEGNCSGATGVYIGSGILVINDAQVKSAAAEYDAAGAGGHANGSGSAIVINSRTNYQGEVAVTVTGDTKAEATSGYALEDVVNTTNNESKVENITIQGGTFEGGAAGALVITEKTATAATVNVTGGNVDGSSEIAKQDLATYLAGQGGTHTTLIEDGGKTILVISEGKAPTGLADFSSDATASVKWTGASKDISGNFALKELEINEATAQLLTVKDGATFTVGRVVMGTKAQIIVEAGGKFIVSDEQGIVAPKASNIVLKNEEGKRSIFLFNPAVVSNRHPNATIEFVTRSWWEDASNYQWENFGIPGALTSITCEKVGGVDVYEEIQVLNTTWESLGYIGGTYTIDVSKMNKPFTAYNIIAYRKQNETAPKCVMTSELVGNDNANLNAFMKWTPFSNSYTGEIDGNAFLSALKASAQNVDGNAIYVAEYAGNGSLVWNAKEGDDNAKIAPMQAFLLNNLGTWAEVNAVNYKSAVYDPATTGAGAPSRMSNDNTAKVRVFVTNEEGVSDYVKLRETAVDNFAFDKFMNEEVNVYAMAEEKSAIIASENIEDTYLGFSTVKGGNLTISFADVEGRQFDLVDLETGARVAASEGETYSFNAAANTTNDYRFKLVARNDAPTAIENTEAVKSVKGIYTITGQYVGEMNVWNTLPAGVYVVDGAKRVK